MKKYLLITTLILAMLITPIIVLASDITNARYFGIIQISNNSTATTNVATTANISTANLINGNYLNASANNGVIRTSSGADVPFMPSVNTTYPWCIWVPSIGENSFQNDILYTANSTGGEIRYFPASGGMTTADNASLELGDNFTIEQKGYIDMTSGNKTLVFKPEAFRTYISGSGNITSRILRIADTFPTGDAGAEWTDRAKAYDDNTVTYSWDDIPAESWGGFIELTTANIECEAIKFYASGESVNINLVDIDVYYEGDWHNVYEGGFTHDTWTTKGFSSDKSITSMRLRFYNAEIGSARMAYLKEARFLTDVAVTATGVSSGEHTIKVTNEGTGGLSFDGVNDSVNITAPSGMEFGTGNFTVTSWIYLGDYTNPGSEIVTVILQAQTPENSSAWGLIFMTDDNATPANRRKAYFQSRTAGGTQKWALTGALTKETWYFMAGKREGGVCYISIDGAAWTTGDSGADMNYSAPNPVKFGASANATARNFLGNIGATRTYSRGLSNSEISDLYDDKAISATGLVGLWELDEGSGVTAIDSSGEGNNGVIDGATWNNYIMKIFIDDALSAIGSGANVTDNDNNWVFLQNNVMPYMESHQITISGVLQQSIAWEYDTTFTDLSGNSHDATPTFRTASSDPDVSAELISFQPVAEAQAPDFVLAEAAPFIDSAALTGNVSGTFTTTPGAGAFPLAGVITAVANATSTPAQLPLLIIAVFVILAASLTVSAIMRQHGSGSVLVKILVITAFLGIFIALGNFAIDFWMLVVFLIIGIALAFASKQLGWA